LTAIFKIHLKVFKIDKLGLKFFVINKRKLNVLG
jgi:hypothetical protein